MVDKIVQEVLENFKIADDAERDIREKSLADLKFSNGDHWPSEIITSRDGRVALTIDKLTPAIRQITNDQRQNRPSLKYSATDESNEDTAKIMEGLARQIQADSMADIAYDTACEMQVRMGFGFFRVVTEYVDEKSFDQKLLIKRIKNPFTVYFDPLAAEPDYSDAKWCIVIADEDRKNFKGNEDASHNYALESVGDTPADWITKETVRVAEYFKIIEKDKTIWQLSNGQVVDVEPDEAALAAQGLTIKNERVTQERSVEWYKLTAYEVLEKKDWPGKYIPIIPVLGEDLDIDGKRVLKGITRTAKDPQRQYNYWTTAITEAIALAPKAPFIMAEGQDKGYEDMWATANTKNYSSLKYRPVTIGGQLVGAPQRNQAEPPVQAMAHAIAQCSDDLKAVTGIFNASLGAQGNETSGKAIIARQKEGDTANFHFQDNLSRSIRWLGVVLEDLIKKVYDGARVVRIVMPDNTSEMVKINQIFQENGKDKMHDLTSGSYDVAVNVGPSYMTKRQEAADSMTAVLQSFPAAFPVIGDLVVKNYDWPGADEIAKRLAKGVPPQFQDDPSGEDIPPQVKNQMGQMQDMIKQLSSALNEAHDKLDQKTVETTSKEKIAEQNNETALNIAMLKAESANNMALFMEELRHLRESQGQMLTTLGQQHSQAMDQASLAQAPQPAQPQQNS